MYTASRMQENALLHFPHIRIFDAGIEVARATLVQLDTLEFFCLK